MNRDDGRECAARIREYVDEQLSKAPPLTDEQRADLARMFSGPGGAHG